MDNKQSKGSQAEPSEKATEDLKAKYEAGEAEFKAQQAEYKKLQDEHRKSMEELKTAKGTLDTLDQYGAIDWGKVSGDTPKEEQPPEMDAQMRQMLQRQEGKILTLQFRLENPDLREYEDELVVPYVLKARQKNPRKSQDEILKMAADDVRGFLTKHEERILEKQKAQKLKEDKEKAGGLDTSSTTTPENEWTNEDAARNYVEARRKQRNKRMGAA